MEVATVAGATEAGADPAAGPRRCSPPGEGYTLSYPAGWYTVEKGPVPCRFFHPEPFRLPAGTEASWVAINVQLAPVTFDEIVRSDADRLAASVVNRREVDVSGRRAVRTVHATSGALLPSGVRVLTWYVEAGGATLVGTTSEAASAGTFDQNADVLDSIVASAVFADDRR